MVFVTGPTQTPSKVTTFLKNIKRNDYCFIVFAKIDGQTQCYVSFLVRNAVFFHQILSDRHALTLQGMLLDPQGVL